MRTAVLIGALLAGVAAFLVPYALALAFVGLALAIFAAWLGARPAGVLAATVLALAALIALPDGLPALLQSFDLNPRRFMRSYGTWVTFASVALAILAMVLALKRRGPTYHHAALEAAEEIDGVVVAIGRVAAFLFIPLMIIIFYDVSQRKIIEYDSGIIDSVFYFSSTKLQELEWHIHAALFLLCLGFAYVKDAHVRIELVRDQLKPRARVWLEMLGLGLFLLPYCWVITGFGVEFAERAWKTGEISAAQTGLTNRWIIKAMLPLGFVILGAAGISAFLKCWVYLFGPGELRARASEYAGTHHADLPSDLSPERHPYTD